MFESISNILIFVLTVWLAYLFFFRKTHLVPRLFIVWLASIVVIRVIDRLLVSSLPLAAEQTSGWFTSELGRSVTNAVIWIPYFIRSIRVRNTFVDTVVV